MLMKYLYQHIFKKDKPSSMYLFMFVYSFLCTAIVLCFALVIGQYTTYNNDWLFYTLSFMIYGGLGLGIYGSLLYILRQ